MLKRPLESVVAWRKLRSGAIVADTVAPMTATPESEVTRPRIVSGRVCAEAAKGRTRPAATSRRNRRIISSVRVQLDDHARLERELVGTMVESAAALGRIEDRHHFGELVAPPLQAG